eukprot:g29830.t1
MALITGGLGGLGMLAANELAIAGKDHVVATSRRDGGHGVTRVFQASGRPTGMPPALQQLMAAMQTTCPHYMVKADGSDGAVMLDTMQAFCRPGLLAESAVTLGTVISQTRAQMETMPDELVRPSLETLERIKKATASAFVLGEDEVVEIIGKLKQRLETGTAGPAQLRAIQKTGSELAEQVQELGVKIKNVTTETKLALPQRRMGIETIVHAAGVLQDGLLLPNLPKAPEMWSIVYGCKAHGAWQIHQATTALAHRVMRQKSIHRPGPIPGNRDACGSADASSAEVSRLKSESVGEQKNLSDRRQAPFAMDMISTSGRQVPRASSGSFFSDTHASPAQYVPRSIFVDTDPSTRDEMLTGPNQKLFHPESVLGYKQDCRNIFFEGRNMARTFQIKERWIAGCGGKKRHTIHNCLFLDSPTSCAPTVTTKIFSTHYMRDVVDVSLMLDNEAAYRVCENKLNIQQPDFDNVNRLIAQCISACTTSLRFETQLHATLIEIVTNIVPTQYYRYPIVSLAPVRARDKEAHETFVEEEIVTELFESKNVLCDVTHLRQNRYLSAVVLLRGIGSPQKEKSRDGSKDELKERPVEANHVITALHSLKDQEGEISKRVFLLEGFHERLASGGSRGWGPIALTPRRSRSQDGTHRSPLKFAPWIQSGFKVGLVGVPPSTVPGDKVMAQTKRQGAMLGNSTAVRQLFVRQYTKFLKLFYRRAYVWQFLEANGEIDSFYDARDGVRDIIGHYEELLQECVRVENEKYDARLAEGERLAVFWVFKHAQQGLSLKPVAKDGNTVVKLQGATMPNDQPPRGS